MRSALVCVSVGLLLGCASPLRWVQAGKSQTDFYRDNSQCLAMSGSGQRPQVVAGGNAVLQGYNQGAAMASSANQGAIYQQCMLGQGWTLTR